MTIRKPAICYACRLLRRDFERGLVCSAFPEGIPEQILDGFDHRKPFPGDGGTRFARDPDVPMPAGFAEEGPVVAEGIFVTKPGEIRLQSDKELRDTAKRMIDRLREHPDRS